MEHSKCLCESVRGSVFRIIAPGRECDRAGNANSNNAETTIVATVEGVKLDWKGLSVQLSGTELSNVKVLTIEVAED